MAGLKAPVDAIWDETDEINSEGSVICARRSSGSSINMLDTPAKSKSKEPEAGGGASMDKGPFCVPCDQCSKEHPPYSYCPYMPCRVCYKDHHPSYCPYLFSIPQGATFNPCFEIICQCGNVFNEDKWVCTFCGRNEAMLISKHCKICNSSNQHGTYECPEDKVVAARNKLARDKIKSIVPNRIAYAPKSSFYVPTPPPGFVNI
ncbi:hypothetical protein ABKV19_000511 [Rosa sericea]